MIWHLQNRLQRGGLALSATTNNRVSILFSRSGKTCFFIAAAHHSATFVDSPKKKRLHNFQLQNFPQRDLNEAEAADAARGRSPRSR
jgi:hypothetical protein